MEQKRIRMNTETNKLEKELREWSTLVEKALDEGKTGAELDGLIRERDLATKAVENAQAALDKDRLLEKEKLFAQQGLRTLRNTMDSMVLMFNYAVQLHNLYAQRHAKLELDRAPAEEIDSAKKKVNLAEAEVNLGDAKINLAKAEVNLAKAEVNLAKAEVNLGETKADKTNAEANGDVAKLKRAEEAIEEAKAKIDEAKASIKEAETKVDEATVKVKNLEGITIDISSPEVKFAVSFPPELDDFLPFVQPPIFKDVVRHVETSINANAERDLVTPIVNGCVCLFQFSILLTPPSSLTTGVGKTRFGAQVCRVVSANDPNVKTGYISNPNLLLWQRGKTDDDNYCKNCLAEALVVAFFKNSEVKVKFHNLETVIDKLQSEFGENVAIVLHVDNYERNTAQSHAIILGAAIAVRDFRFRVALVLTGMKPLVEIVPYEWSRFTLLHYALACSV